MANNADASGEAETGSSWPLPPTQFIDNYTDEAVQNNTAPPPPTPITTESYSMFGCPFFPNESIIRSLESQKVRRLYPSNYDHKRELKRMNHSLLANFLDLLDILVKAPDSEKRIEKIEDIKLLFINMHHLINEYRQHQARETIRVMMAVQKKQRIEIAERFQRQLEKVTDTLQTHLSSIPDAQSLIEANQEPQAMDDDSGKTNGTSIGELKTLSLELSNMDELMCEIVDSLDSSA